MERGYQRPAGTTRRGFMRSNCTMSRRRAGPTSSYKNRSPYKIPTVHLRATGERFLARSNTGLRATKRAPGGVITGWTAVTATGGMSVPNYGTAILKNRYVLPASSLAASRAGAELSAGMPLRSRRGAPAPSKYSSRLCRSSQPFAHGQHRREVRFANRGYRPGVCLFRPSTDHLRHNGRL